MIWGRGEKDKLNSCHPLAPHWDKSFNSLFCPRERSWEQGHFDGAEKVRSQVTMPVCHCAWLWSQSSSLPHQPWARIMSASWRVKKDLLEPAQVGCMRQALGPGALGRPRGIRWRGRWEGGSGWGTHVNPWLFHFNVWQNPIQYKKFKKK